MVLFTKFFALIALFSFLDYYQNVETQVNKKTPKASVPRQPASTCIAEEMNKLHLNITAATG